MYIPQHFAETRVPVLHELMRRFPLATLVAVTARGLDANHLPLVLDHERGELGTLRGHVARSNPAWREAPAGSEVLAIFHGDDSYISPSWYPTKREHGKVVPTWNYAVVHARGRIDWHDDPEWLRDLVETLTNLHERGSAEPWHVADAPAEFVERNLRSIVGFEIRITALDGKWKVSQNRAPEERAAVVKELRARGDAASLAMAELIAGAGRG
jgi:transcriptional regulator